MKKLLALALTLVLLCAAIPALADEYQSRLLADSTLTQEQLVTEAMRPVTAATILLDYMLVKQDTTLLDQLAASDCYVGQYGSFHVDVYYPLTNGKYLNLFYSAYSHKVTVFSNATYNPAINEYTYYTLSAEDLVSALGNLVNALSGN